MNFVNLLKNRTTLTEMSRLHPAEIFEATESQLTLKAHEVYTQQSAASKYFIIN